MADNVIVNPSASYTVAAEDIGVSVEVQRIKVVLGTSGVDGGNVGLTNPMPVTGTVAVPAGLSVSAQVSGTVTVSAGVSVSAQVSGTVTAAVPAGLSVSAVVSGTVTAVVTGPVSVSAMPAVSISVSAALGTVITVLGTQVVTVVPGLSVSAVVSGTVTAVVTGPVSISAMPAISVSVSAVLGTVVTVLGTLAVNVVAGGAGGGSVTTAPPSVSASGQLVWIVGGQSTTAFPIVVTGTVTAGAGTTVVSIGNIVPVTTAASVSVTGLPVWLNPTQAVVVNTIAAGFSVQALVTGPVSISAMPAISVSVSAVLGTVVTVLGTVAVNVVAGGAAPGTTAATQSAISAQVVWLAPTQTVSATVNTIAAGFSVQALVTGPVSISVMPAVSISVSAALGTVITILGTQVVSVVPGLSVSAVVSGTVTAVVTGPVSISAMPAISISVSAILGTVVTVLGTVLVSQAGLKFTTATPTVTETGPVVWLANTVTVTVTATVTGSLIISGVPPVTTALVSGNTGLGVWPGTPAYQPVLIMVTSTAGLSAGSIYLMTVWTAGAQAAAGTSAYPVPAGKNLRLLNMQAGQAGSAAVLGTIQFMVIAATATASMVSGSIPTQGHPIILQMQLSTVVPSFASIVNCLADIPAATTIGIFVTMGTSCTIPNIIVQGYLF